MNANGLITVSVLLFWVSSLLSGCAIGNKHHYNDVPLAFQTAGDKSVGLATHDKRKYIASGDKAPDFVGLSRGGYGNTFDITTSTGHPLVEDITSAIERGLKEKGFRPIRVIVAASDSFDVAIKKLSETKAERQILIRVLEWKSDTYVSTGLFYDVAVTVYDATGNMLAEKAIKGYDKLGGSFWNPPSHAKEAVPKAFAAKMEELFNNPEIEAALR